MDKKEFIFKGRLEGITLRMQWEQIRRQYGLEFEYYKITYDEAKDQTVIVLYN